MKRTINSWAARIIIPSALTVLLFTVAVFLIIIPVMHNSLIERKREMIWTLTESAWHSLEYFHRLELAGILSQAEAQQHAIDQVKCMRYGPEGKDYFWINDMHPNMIMHPYLPELDGTDLTDWKDPNGKRLFVEFVAAVEADGEGYVDYMWQWKDDPDVIAQKVSFVKGFQPWGWVIGTGIYIDDVEQEIQTLTNRLALICGTILFLVAGLLLYNVLQSLRGERMRKKAEDALRDNIKYLAAVINTTSEGFWMVGPDGLIRDVNCSLTDMLGFSRAQMLGSPPDRYIVEASDFRSAPDKQTSPFALNRTTELMLLRSDGSQMTVLLHGSSLAGEGEQEEAGVFAFLTDITEIKHVEERLRESEDRYRRLVETAPVGILIHRNNLIQYSNRTLVELLGYESSTDLVGHNINDFLDEESQLRARERISKIITSGAPLPPGMLTLIRSDGRLLFTEVTSAPISKQLDTAILTVILDRTERYEFEQELDRLFTAIEQADEVFVITDADLGILYVNKAIESITNLTPEQFKGKELNEIIHTKDTAVVISKIKESIDRSEVWRGQLDWTSSQGAAYVVDMTVSPVESPGGDIKNYVAVIRDVTRETALERQLRHSQKLEAIGNLAGGIAHDFNNILYAIIGYSDMALEELDESGFPHECVSEIITAASRAAELVKQILSFARQAELRKANIELIPIIKEVLKLLRSTLPSNIEIRQQIPVTTATVCADPTELHQVVMNLCTNAGHVMMAEGGTLEIVIREVDINQESLSTVPQLSLGAHILISISDTGPGIPEDIKDRIFEPFFTTKERGKGTGMGLSVVHGIVSALGGAINVYSELGHGSTFNVYLPVVPGKATVVREQVPVALLRGSERVLVVDDEEIIVAMLSQMLTKLGYRVTAFTSSSRALKAFEQEPDSFDVVITDQTMPQITGDVLARRILEIRPELPIILATGFSQTISVELAQEIGIKAFLTKPIFKADLARSLRQVLDETDS